MLPYGQLLAIHNRTGGEGSLRDALPTLVPKVVTAVTDGSLPPRDLALTGISLAVAVIFLLPPLSRAILVSRRSAIWAALRLSIVLVALALSGIQATIAILRTQPFGIDATVETLRLPMLALGLVCLVVFALPGYYGRALARERRRFDVVMPERPPTPAHESLTMMQVPAEPLRDQTGGRAGSGPQAGADGGARRNYVAEIAEDGTVVPLRRTMRARIVHNLAALIAVGAVAIGVWGYAYARFVPEAGIPELVPEFAPAFAAVVGIFGALMGLTSPGTGRDMLRSRPVMMAAYGLAFGGAAWLLAPSFLNRGLPGVHAQAFEGRLDVAQVTVVARGRGVSRRGCGYTATVTGTDLAGAGGVRVCGIDPADWEKLEPGDRLELTGWRTPYGLRYRQARLAVAPRLGSTAALPQIGGTDTVGQSPAPPTAPAD